MIKTYRIVNEDALNKAKTWLGYIPVFWNLEYIMGKPARMLTRDELRILEQVKDDEEMSKFCDEVLGAVDGDHCVWLTIDEGAKLDRINDYLENEEYFSKINRLEKAYSKILVDESLNANKEMVSTAISNIQNYFLREYVCSQLKHEEAKKKATCSKCGERVKHPKTDKPHIPRKIR